MSDRIRIYPAEGTWVVRAEGAVIAESPAALEVTLDEAAPVIHFPRADVAMAFVEPSGTRSVCPVRGEGVYYDIVTSAGVLRDAGWAYENPPEDHARIAGCLAFDTTRVTVERL